MKILYFHQYFSTRAGSGGNRSYEMAKRLVARGHCVTMVCSSSDRSDTGLVNEFKRGRREGEVEGIRVIEFRVPTSNRHGLLRRSWNFLQFAIKSLDVALFRDCDLVFATSTPLTASIPGIAAKLFRGRKFVFEVRDLWPELPRAMGVIKSPVALWGMEMLEKASYGLSDACVGLAPGIVSGIKKIKPSLHVEMIPNCCDMDLFDAGQPGLLHPPGIGRDDFLAVFAGAHGPANGLDAILDAGAELCVRGRKDIKILLVGDGKCKDRLVRRKDEEGIDSVLFMEPIPRSRMPALLRRADVGLQTLADVPAFYYGTSPNKFFDYIASGRPVICNYPGWVSDLLLEYRCGVACKPGDRQGFADALEYLADHRTECGQMGEQSRLLAGRIFDRDRLAIQFCELLERVADGV